MKKKVIILGFDGALLDLIKQWVQQDRLPNFKMIMEKGVYGQLQTTIPPLTPCAWSSFMTGKNPGKHGIYDFSYLDEKHELRIRNANDRSSKDLWEYLTDSNLKSFVFNVPFTYPPKDINGVMVTDFTTPSTDVVFTHPSSLKNEILERYPHFRISEKNKYAENKKSREDFRTDAFALADTRYEIAHELMTKQEFDLYMLVFMLIDRVQHWYWKYMDRSHPKYEENARFEHTVKEAYEKMDVFLGRVMKDFPDHNLVLMSDHGAGPYYKDVTINKWLLNEKYLFVKENVSFIKRIAGKIGIGRLMTKGLNLRLWKFVNNFPWLKKNIQTKLALTYNDIDWEKTLAYSYGCYGPIYVNDANVKSPQEREQLRSEIKEKIKKIKDPRTGEALITQVWDREELYSGEKFDSMPDIIIKMGEFSYASSSLFPFSSNQIFSEPKTFKSGDHSQFGIFMAFGPDVKKGIQIKNANICDIAPTILHMFNVPIPNDMDGRVLNEIFKDNSEFQREVEYQDSQAKNQDGQQLKIQSDDTSKRHEEEIKERLEGLGYL